ncbi:TnsA-like heteromeric transposase endonuclease subunit [Saccharopolyspora shandongensis]|uniref:TnsA-like heteromeric transposase endonuclease subunit n=1 Tax=Saccharopolyspora shandongensis TaxID=418495 RepID=UPI00340CCF46
MSARGALRIVAGSSTADPPAETFVVGFVGDDGVECQQHLHECADRTFENGAPVRSFPSYRGQRNWPGLWWSSTLSAHVGFESWLERDHVMLMDFDPDVVSFAAQPFWLFFRDERRTRSHAPDFFARHRDGSATVIDCRPDGRIKPRDTLAFDATARACQQAGWSYKRVGEADPVVLENVRWLAGYRHPRFVVSPAIERLRSVFATPRPLVQGADLVEMPRLAVLPALFHLLWTGELTADLSVTLNETTVVREAS